MMTTHLICSTPEGPKYEASVKWGVPVVSKEWLLKCVTCKRRLPEDKFPIAFNGKYYINWFNYFNFNIASQILINYNDSISIS